MQWAPPASRSDAERPRAGPLPEAHSSLGKCRLAFKIRDGVITAFRATGFDYFGMKAEHECTFTVRACAPEPPDPS